MFKEGTVLCTFYCAYLKERIECCFKQNRDYFKQKELIEGFGKVPELEKLVMESVVSLYSLELEKQIRFNNDAEEAPRMEETDEKVNAQWDHQLIFETYSEESWSELELLSGEIERVDYWKD